MVVFSDHKPLENLNVKVRTDEELGDLTNYLSQFDFSIKYNPGQNNAEADCLSRNPVLESNININEDILKTVNLLTLEEIKDDQKNMIVEKNNVQENGIIYKTVRGKKKIRLSNTGGKKLIQRIHQKMGHVGMNHLINMSTPYYYSEHMYKQIKEISSKCEICIKNKSRNNRRLGLLGHLGPATKPFEIMSLDTIGGFGGRRSTKRYMHLLVDHFTRYAYITTAKNQTSTDFIKIIKSVQNENKIGTLLTDQYGGINSKEFKDYLHNENINLIFTAIDSPSSNCLNERLNQTLVNRIRCKINEGKSNKAWSTIARICVNEYNRSIHSVTKFSPAYLMCGRVTPFIPSTLQPKYNIEQDSLTAFDNSLKVHNQNEKPVNKNRKFIRFKIGDLVYVENGNKLNRRKLDEIRIGPLPIIERLSNTVYAVECGSSKDKRLFHISKMITFEKEKH